MFDVSKFASRGRDALLNGCHNLTKAMPIVSFVLKGHKSSVNCLDYRNNLLLSGSDDQTARIWDVRTSKTCLCLRTTGEVTSVAFAGPQGKEDNVNLTGLPFAKNTSVFLSVENAVLEYDLRQAEVPVINRATRDLTEELKTDDEVNQLCVSKNRLLAAADDSGTVRIWDGTHTRVLQPESEHPFLMTSCCYRSGDQLASGGTNCTVYLWDIGRPRKPLDALLIPRDDDGANQMCNPPMVHALSWSPSGRLLAAGLGDGSIQIMGVVKRKLSALARLRDGHGASVASLCFPDFGLTGANTDRIVASAGTDGAIIVWDLKRSVGGDSSLDPHQILSHELLKEDLSNEPSIVFGIPHAHKANCLVSSRTNTLYVADTSNEITGYTIPLQN